MLEALRIGGSEQGACDLVRTLCRGGIGGNSKLKAGGVGGGLFLPVLLVLVALDQISKFLVEGRMRLGLEVPIVPGLFSLTRVHNTGVAFGMAQGNNLLTGLLAVGILIFAGWMAWTWDWRQRWVQGVAGLVAGGAVGNLIDRVRVGHVIDFLDFHYGHWSWPAFNVADAAISVGVGWLVLSWLVGQTPEPK
ncbi:signal peptidase II [bacterium]|nr:signal peptidase II [bacterium]